MTFIRDLGRWAYLSCRTRWLRFRCWKLRRENARLRARIVVMQAEVITREEAEREG